MRTQNINRLSTVIPFRSEDVSDLKSRWGWFFASGLALTLLGMIALGTSVIATVVTITFLGSVLLVGGVIQMVHSFAPHRWGNFLGSFFAGVLTTLAGFIILRSPAATAVMLTFLLAPIFMSVGFVRMIGSVASGLPRWGWSLLSGLVTFVLGLMIWNQWPGSGLWVIGTLIAVELIINGISTIAFAMAIKEAREQHISEKIAA